MSINNEKPNHSCNTRNVIRQAGNSEFAAAHGAAVAVATMPTRLLKRNTAKVCLSALLAALKEV